MSNREKAYLINYNKDYFKRGKISDIIGIKKVTTYNSYGIANPSKLCYHIVFDDSQQDFVEIDNLKEAGWYIVTLDELLSVGMPRPQ